MVRSVHLEGNITRMLAILAIMGIIRVHIIYDCWFLYQCKYLYHFPFTIEYVRRSTPLNLFIIALFILFYVILVLFRAPSLTDINTYSLYLGLW